MSLALQEAAARYDGEIFIPLRDACLKNLQK